MQITPLLSTVGNTGAEAPRSNIAGDFDRFLTLLTTQLQNQDPLAPLDATEFTNQLVQFSQVEQTVNMNKRLGDLLTLQESAQAQTAIGYVGRTVDALGHELPLIEGGAGIFYAIEGTPAIAILQLLDQNGRAVRTLPASTEPGMQRLAWDGKDDTGKQLPDGTYKVQLIARDADNKALTSQTGFTGRVDQIANSNGAMMLSVGDVAVPLTEIVAVRAPAEPA